MRDVVIGLGEIGKAIRSCYDGWTRNEMIVTGIDKGSTKIAEADVMHICFPYDNNFEFEVLRYAKEIDPNIIIIHSTVPVGTTRKIYDTLLQRKVVAHSPIVGKHPDLKDSIQNKFIKTFAGLPNSTATASVLKNKLHIQEIKEFKNPESTELAKLLSTTEYAWHIMIATEVNRLCEALNLPFGEVYSFWRSNYNRGYEKKYSRPILEPCTGTIGGHCILENLDLLKKNIKTWMGEV